MQLGWQALGRVVGVTMALAVGARAQTRPEGARGEGCVVTLAARDEAGKAVAGVKVRVNIRALDRFPFAWAKGEAVTGADGIGRLEVGAYERIYLEGIDAGPGRYASAWSESGSR